MASPTRITKCRRRMKKAARGLDRKNRIAREGSTPVSLKLDRPNANELAQIKKAQAAVSSKA